MRITKILPTGSALRVASDLMFRSTGPELAAEDHEKFSRWINERWVDHRTLVSAHTVTADQAADLIADAPTDTVGRAWAAEMQRVLDLTLADQVRPWDLVKPDVDSGSSARAAAEALEALAERLRAASPLLDTVADALCHQVNDVTTPIGELLASRALVSDSGLLLDALAHGVPGCEWDEDLEKIVAVVPWSHIDAVRALAGDPGDTRAEVTALLAALDADLPPVAEDDQARARGRGPRD